ncbi:FMN-linked oxidoreductase [Thozetella sp. PMI_491]|nr:FMN-linked oxidoreductase [Thozetella sp. PMI_491]
MAQQPPLLKFSPPLVNSSNPWATTLDDLQKLYACPSTGAVTTRTALLGKGFPQDPSEHDFVFLNSLTHQSSKSADSSGNASLNSFGYSPLPLDQYLGFIKTIAKEQSHLGEGPAKGFIVSVTGDPGEVASCYRLIATTQKDIQLPLAMEINLSCPNIPGKTPPAYSSAELIKYIDALAPILVEEGLSRIPFGFKTPPYTHSQQFKELITALVGDPRAPEHPESPVSFISATNTLGNCLVLDEVQGGAGVVPSSLEFTAALPGVGLGGLAGAPLHPLALGNVSTLHRLLDEAGLGHIQILGIGGVLDAAGYKRMRHAGASMVGVGTGLGLKGTDIFKQIDEQLGGQWE